MPKFKPGDIVYCASYPTITYKILKVDTLNQLYTSEVYTSSVSWLTIGDIQHDPIALLDQIGNIVTPLKLNLPLYNISDVLTLASDKSYQLLITKIDNTSQEYIVKYIAIPVGKEHLLNTELKFSWNMIEKDCIPLMMTINPKAPPEFKIPKCICNSRDLFNKGCKCGNVKAYKLKWE